MTTTSKAGAQGKNPTRPDALERDEQDPTVQLGIPGSRDTRPVAAVYSDAVEQPPAREDDAATVLRESVRPEPVSRPRKNTLAMAITRPVRQDEASAVGTPPAGVPSQQRPPRASGAISPKAPAPSIPPVAPPDLAMEDDSDDMIDDDVIDDDVIDDDVIDEVDEWAVADQPTVYLSPHAQQSPRPAFLETGEGHSWPPRPAQAGRPAGQPRENPRLPLDERQQTPQRPAAPAKPGAVPPQIGSRRLASPTGRPMPGTPPAGVPRAALPNPRMQRFQELRGQRETSDGHERLHQESRPVAEVARQWWRDLRPGLEGALHYQREAKASGIHPIPAHEPTPTSRLGDAFGRVAASARDLTERAQAAAAPALKRLHAQAEQAAQALVDRFEGSPARQQFPLLGPGRIAVFFKQGVTVGQAQKLLAASQARPIRLIPRKHGFLSLVPPGSEAEVAERLRIHPYVRDVAYLEYDEYGQVIPPER